MEATSHHKNGIFTLWDEKQGDELMDAHNSWNTLLLVLDGNNECELIKPALVTNLRSHRTLGQA